MADMSPAWTILSEVERTGPNATGRFGTGVVVTFKTRGGATGSVFVPDDQFNPDAVRTAVSARAAVLDEVLTLKG